MWASTMGGKEQCFSCIDMPCRESPEEEWPPDCLVVSQPRVEGDWARALGHSSSAVMQQVERNMNALAQLR